MLQYPRAGNKLPAEPSKFVGGDTMFSMLTAAAEPGTMLAAAVLIPAALVLVSIVVLVLALVVIRAAKKQMRESDPTDPWQGGKKR